MTGTADVDWEECAVEGCTGVKANSCARCVLHAASEERSVVLERLAETGDMDARGVTISADLLREILASVPRDTDDRPRFAIADFRGATFVDEADFRGVVFGSIGWFDRVMFQADARFDDATFEHDAGFMEATFRGLAIFHGARVGRTASFASTRFAADAGFTSVVIGGDAEFGRANFGERVQFHGASFGGSASFQRTVFGAEAGFGLLKLQEPLAAAAFEGEAYFGECTFRDHAGFGRVHFVKGAIFSTCSFEASVSFRRTEFEDHVSFDGAGFAGETTFELASFAGDLRFSDRTRFGDDGVSFAGATFDTTRHIGPLISSGNVSFADATFLPRADLDVWADGVTLARARFPEGVNLWLRWAEVVLDKAEFGAPSIVSSSSDVSQHRDPAVSAPYRKPPRHGLPGEEALAARYTDIPARTARPRLVSMRWAIVDNLTVSGVDLAPCRFLGVHHLEKLRIEGGSSFASTPEYRWLTHRLALAEEHTWRAVRASQSRRARKSAPEWYPPECRTPVEFEQPPPNADDIAAIYRALRKGREENKDEPGAADFYYGEMEMRRLNTRTRPAAERAIVTLYWLISGYGLRASRAVAALLLTVVLFGVALHAWGFPDQVSVMRALTFSLESTISLFRAPQHKLTLAGEWLQLGLRLLGPLFFGLALLSLRGRVKR